MNSNGQCSLATDINEADHVGIGRFGGRHVGQLEILYSEGDGFGFTCETAFAKKVGDRIDTHFLQVNDSSFANSCANFTINTGLFTFLRKISVFVFVDIFCIHPKRESDIRYSIKHVSQGASQDTTRERE